MDAHKIDNVANLKHIHVICGDLSDNNAFAFEKELIKSCKNTPGYCDKIQNKTDGGNGFLSDYKNYVYVLTTTNKCKCKK